MVVSRKFEPAGMEVKGVAAALQHDAAEIIGSDAARGATPIVEGMDVAEEKVLQGWVEEELQPQGTTVARVKTKAERRRRARPRETSLKLAQSACACSPGKVRKRKKASCVGGRISATTRRS
ncbi:MAG: hypothetical protein ACLQOO_06775 [Terriglobia bacterium]